METIRVNAHQPYDVIVGKGIISECGALIAKCIPCCTAAIVTDDVVSTIFGEEVEHALRYMGFNTVRIVFPHGEQNKNMKNLSFVLEKLAENRITRTDFIVALGGGVVGDLAGFAAATYMRGIAYVQIPTSFLSAIDSSVGGKTAVDLSVGKNLAGVFWQPRLVLCDTSALMTLPEQYFTDGLGEAIKYAVGFDNELFKALEDGDVMDNINDVVARCIKIKARLVEVDEFDVGERRKLNLGHTVGHAIEACSGFSISHGCAVAIGTVIITRASVKKRIAPMETLERIQILMKKLEMNMSCDYSAKQLAEAALNDKKRRGSMLSLIVPTSIGSSSIMDIAVGEFEQWIELGLK